MVNQAPSFLVTEVTKVDPKLLTMIREEYGALTTAFQFNKRFKKVIQTWIKEFREYGGTLWGVDELNNRLLLFDQAKHGYNGMMDLGVVEDHSSVKSMDLNNNTTLIIAFQYNGDEADCVGDGASDLEEDYFGWVVIYALTDGELDEIFSYECS